MEEVILYADSKDKKSPIMDEYRKWLSNKKYSINTKVMYCSIINNFLGEDGKIINSKSYQKFVDKFRQTHIHTVDSSAIRSFFRFLAREKDYPMDLFNVQFEKVISTKPSPETVSVEEVEQVIKAMPNLRLQYFTIFMFELGLRISEALKVRWEDINFIDWLKDRTKKGKVTIKNTKGNKTRTLPVKAVIMEMLYSIDVPRTSLGQPIGDVIFDIRIKDDLDGFKEYANRKENTPEENLHKYIQDSKDYYRVILYKVSERVIGKKIHPHMFRHIKSLFLLNKGTSMDVLKEFLGHSSLTSTEVYAQASTQKIEKELDKYDNYDQPINLNTSNNI